MFSRPTLEAFRRIVPVVVFRRGFLYECRIGFFKSVCVCVLRQQKKTICQAHYIRFFKLHPLKCRKKRKVHIIQKLSFEREIETIRRRTLVLVIS